MEGSQCGLNLNTLSRIASEIKDVAGRGIQVCLVIGGGNIFRGVSDASQSMERASADYMGMLATVINSLAMQDALEALGVQTRVQSAITMTAVCEPYIRRKAVRHLEKGRVVIFAAGTGNPYFTTDTAAALRASEMNCDAMFKGTNVDGIYDKDPKKHPEAKRYKRISYNSALAKHLKFMDATAIALARENKLPIVVFPIYEEGALLKIINGKGNYTIVTEEEGDE